MRTYLPQPLLREFLDGTSVARRMICINLTDSLIDVMVVVRHEIQSDCCVEGGNYGVH